MTILNQLLERVLSAADREIPPPVELGWQLGVGAPDSPQKIGVVPEMERQFSQGTPLGDLNDQFMRIQEASRTLDTGRRVVDIAAVLDAQRERMGLALDWRHSMADLLQLVGLDHSLETRRALARELDETADGDDIPSLDRTLHAAVMRALAEGGGDVPPELQR
jgi:hypothetical protein